MIDGLAEMLPARVVEINIRGKVYRLGELTARDYAEMSAHLIARRPNPLDAVKGHLDGFSEIERHTILGRAFDAARRAPIVSQFELNEFQMSIEGAIFMFWLAARKHQPEMTLAATEQLLDPIRPATVEAIQGVLDQLHGLPAPDPQ